MGQFRRSSRRAAWSLPALALASCSGGQSGTDADYGPTCPYDVEAVELELPWQSGLTVAEHVALLNTEWTVHGEVAPLDELPLMLSVDPEAAVLYRRDTTQEPCIDSGTWLSVDADVHLKLGDTFDFFASGLLLQLTADGAQLFQSFCWDSETHTASLMEESCEAGVESGFLSLELKSRTALDGPGSYLLDRFSIYWDSSANTDHYELVTEPPEKPAPPEPYPALPEVREVCALSEDIAAGSFDTEADAMAAVIGTWALCDAERPWPFAGVEISSNGTWKAIVAEGGALRISQGFEREGTLRFWDTSEQNERPGFFQLDLIGPHWWFPAGAIFVSASGNTLDLSQAKLVRIDQTVNPEPAPDAQAGDRLGEAACASGETDMQNIGASAADVRQSLAGEYVGCAGLSGSLRFDAGGNVTVEAADGEELQTLSFTVGQTLDDNAVLTVGDETWYPVLSSRPVKLWIRRSRNSDFAELETWVLAARPR